MRIVFALLPLALATACVSPRDACLSDATQALRINEVLIAKTQANLERGYAVDVKQRVSQPPVFCGFPRTNVGFGRDNCNRVRVRNVAVPEPINTRVEQETLDQLIDKRADLQRQANARIAQCQALPAQ